VGVFGAEAAKVSQVKNQCGDLTERDGSKSCMTNC